MFGKTAAAGQLADVVHLPLSSANGWADHGARLIVQGAVLGLDPFIKRDRYDLADYFPGCLPICTWRGTLYGLLTEVITNLVFYNQDLLAAAGVPAPSGDWTWHDLLAHAQTLTDRQAANSIYGFAMLPDYIYMFPWIWGNGGDILSADLTRSLVDQPPAQEALQWVADLQRTHQVIPTQADLKGVDISRELFEELFRESRLAMVYIWRDWFQGKMLTARLLTHPQLQAGLAEPPQGPAQRANWLGAAFPFHIGGATEVPDEAWTFLRWWTGVEAQRGFQQGRVRKGAKATLVNTAPPARRSLATELADWFGQPVPATLEYARDLPLHPRVRALAETFDAGLEPFWKGEQSVEQATAEVARRQNEILAEAAASE